VICWTFAETTGPETTTTIETNTEPDQPAALAAAAAAARRTITAAQPDNVARYTLTVDNEPVATLAVTATADGPDTGPALAALDELTRPHDDTERTNTP